MAAISLRGIRKTYGDGPEIVKGLDLDIHDGEFMVFVGPSGCGKSTLLRMIAGLEDISAGQLRIGELLANDLPPAERGIAMVFQSYALYPHMTARENMGFALKMAGRPDAEVRAAVGKVAEILQITHLLERKPKALSGGERQRVAIGRAIVRRPGVFLFDEPLSNLDATLRGQTRIEIARLHKQFVDASVVYVTHDQVEAMTLADKIVLLRAGPDVQRLGSIAQVGSPLELYHRPNSRFVAGFIGSPQMNFLPASVVAGDAAVVRVTLAHSGEALAIEADGRTLHAGQSVCVGVRPEHLLLAPQDGNRIVRRVLLVERLGEQTYLHFEQAGGEPLLAKAPGNVAIDAGAELALGMLAQHCHLFTDDGSAVAAPVPSIHRQEIACA